METPHRRIAALTQRRLLAAGMLVAFGFCALMAARFGAAHIRSLGWWNPLLECDPRSIDLRTVETAGRYPCQFVIANRGQRALDIHRVRVGCSSCLKVIQRPTVPIPPQGEAVIAVELLTRGMSGPVIRTLALYSNDPLQPTVVLTIKADVQ